MFWIRMMKSWGFDLINQYKVTPPVNNQYSKEKSSYTGVPKNRKSRYWEKDDIFVGKEYIVDRKKKNSFRTIFVGKMKEFELPFYLKYEDFGDKLKCIVIESKPIPKDRSKKGFWPKGEDRKPRYSKGREDTVKLRQVGLEVTVSGYSSVRCFASVVSDYLKDIPVKRFNYELLENGDIKAIRIY